jgi:hypothetical protein
VHLRMASDNRKNCGLARILALTLTALALPTGCRPHRTSDLRMECHVLPWRPHVGPAEVRVTLTDSRHVRVRGAQVSVEADMSHPGMKPLLQNASATDHADYTCKLNFDMPGDWTLLLHAKLPNGETVDNQVSLTVLEK